MRALLLLCISITFVSCGNNPLDNTDNVTRREVYRSALTAEEKADFLKYKSRVLMVCDVLNKREFVYFERYNSHYHGYVSDGENSVKLTTSNDENDINLGHSFNLFYHGESPYLESNDFIEFNGEFHKLEVMDESDTLRVINLVKINDDFSTTVVERLYELVNCAEPVREEDN